MTQLRNILAVALLAMALTQIVGHLVGSRVLRGIGACTAASPFPKVFSDVDGLETFACTYTMIYDTPGGERRAVMTPERYQQLEGPYNRRNVYGAALAYGPRLPETLWQAVFCYGLRDDGPFRAELGIPANATRVRVLIEDKTRGRDGAWVLEPACAQ